MTNVLIPTHAGDAHALAVATALEAKGHRATRWFGADCPERQTQTIRLGGEARLHVRARDERDSFVSDEFEAVWYRRPEPAIVPHWVHPSDELATRIAWKQLFESSWFLFSPQTFWVNPVDRFVAANSKPLQLMVAERAGFDIPDTLISNDPEAVREFVGSLAGDAIYKNFASTDWVGEACRAVSRTVSVSLADLDDDEVIRTAPGIFQRRVHKRFEVRATFFGRRCLAVAIDSAGDPAGDYDWRSIPGDRLRIESLELPKTVYDRCTAMMDELGLVFGCFDFIVEPNGRYVFLEVNEMGQFLWIEERVPHLRMLDTFCALIVSRDPRYEGGADDSPPVSFAQLASSTRFRDAIHHDRERHVAGRVMVTQEVAP